MGMDGLSMKNAGVNQQTSADLSSKTEQTVKSDPTNDSSQIQDLDPKQRVKEKEESDENSGRHAKRDSETIEDSYIPTENNEEDLDLDVIDVENPNKDFYVKLNSKNDIIELYDTATDRLIETISGEELGALIKKLNMASGIFVNKKV